MGLRRNLFKNTDMSNEDIPTIINWHEPHLACLFVLDNSETMSGEKIRELNNGVRQIKADICKTKF